MAENTADAMMHKPQSPAIKVLRPALIRRAASRRINELEERLKTTQNESNTDALTGLPNRRWLLGDEEKKDHKGEFYRQFEEAKRLGNKLSVLMIDIDDFKSINELYGHPKGDEALKFYADQMKSRLRKSDSVARYGGEEFLALLPDTSDLTQEQVSILLRRFQYYLHESMPEDVRLQRTMSIGVSTFSPDDDKDLDPDELIKRADEAASYVKKTGKRTYAVWTPDLREKLRALTNPQG